MGLDYEQLRERDPRLIYVSGTGFGKDGPWQNLGIQDMVLQSVSGATWHNRDADGRPQIHPIPFIDFGTGMAMVQGVLLALLERGASGLGQRVDVSLLDTALFEQMQEYTAWMLRRHEIHWERDNLVGSLSTANGWIAVVGLFQPDPLGSICRALEIDDLTARPEFADAAARQEQSIGYDEAQIATLLEQSVVA
ncbi:CoA transferase [Microbacterium sp. Root53]|uniref:CoA transferase n=1 Tax=Microbacterium sp. Root53 TaxID=1736553 RepID=UPI002E10A182